MLKGGPGRDTYICGTGVDVVISDFFRHPDELVGDGCEAVIFEPSGATMLLRQDGWVSQRGEG